MTFTIHSPKYGKHTIEIDDEDWDKVKNYKWRVYYRKRNGRNVLGNVRAHNKQKDGTDTGVYIHRIIMPGCGMVDHVDNNKLNNKKSNLRPCLAHENMQNRKAYINSKTGFKGVYYYSRIKKYRAQINTNNKHIWLGDFDTKEDAARAYNKAAIQHHGVFARLNVL